jgi:hypothetical protein
VSKSRKKNVNPNRIPVSKADLNRAKEEATRSAMSDLAYLFLFILKDKHDAPEEDIQQFAEEINYYAESIREGRLTWADVRYAVRTEYNITVRL